MPCLRIAIVFVLLLLSHSPLALGGEDEVVSSLSMMVGSAEIGEFAIRPAPDAPTLRYTEDYGPVQVLELVRPEGTAVKVGRLFSSCGCLRASMAKRDWGGDERIRIEVRNVKPALEGGATYMIFVQLEEPVAGVLQYDIFVKSDRRE